MRTQSGNTLQETWTKENGELLHTRSHTLESLAVTDKFAGAKPWAATKYKRADGIEWERSGRSWTGEELDELRRRVERKWQDVSGCEWVGGVGSV